MKTLLIILSTLFFSIYTFGQEYDEEYGQPIIVLYQTDPWLMVIGSDVPVFALYENGQIIYRKVVDKKYKYFEVKNDREKTQKIIKTFGITDELVTGKEEYQSSNATDQPTNILLLNFNDFKNISVYGDLNQKEDREKTPKEFLTVYDNLLKFEDKTAKEWHPKKMEILTTDYSHSPEKPLQWNKEWSDLNSKDTVNRNEELYSIYLDKKYFPDFILLMKSLNEKQAVEINGKKFSLSYRLPFPNLK